MMLLLVALARGADCDPRVAVAPLLANGAKEDYLCLVEAEDGRAVLLDALAAPPAAGAERLTRALALWLLQRGDAPMDPSAVEKLSASDRRLVADGIRARRGRASPAANHAKVFDQFAWYAPVPTYTDGRLRPVDRENLLLVDPPVRTAPPPPTIQGLAPTPEEERAASEKDRLCGCASAPGAGGGALLVALAALVRRRRAR